MLNDLERLRSYARQIKGKSGYVLKASKEDPRKKRWQKLETDAPVPDHPVARAKGRASVDPEMPEGLLLPVSTAAHLACQDCRKCGKDAPCGLGGIEFPAIPEDKRWEFSKNIFHFFGNVIPGDRISLQFYDLPFETGDAHELAKQHGFGVKFFGGSYGPPNFRDYNYQTGWLNIYDPGYNEGTATEDAPYREKWRIVHELSHALTEDDLNKAWGTGRRAGGLGKGLSLHDALRAIDWEDKAITTQHGLLKKHFGINVDEPTANKEMNTTLADAIIRVYTGQFSDPDLDGFHPSPYRVPTKRALELTLALGNSLGLDEEIGQNPYGFTRTTPKRSYAEAQEMADWDEKIGFGAGRGYSWNGPHFASLKRLGG